jgi:hypothetical protein
MAMQPGSTIDKSIMEKHDKTHITKCLWGYELFRITCQTDQNTEQAQY